MENFSPMPNANNTMQGTPGADLSISVSESGDVASNLNIASPKSLTIYFQTDDASMSISSWYSSGVADKPVTLDIVSEQYGQTIDRVLINFLRGRETVTSNWLASSNVNITINGVIYEYLGEKYEGELKPGQATVYYGGNGGEYTIKANVHAVPEPATATLSLLALAGLAARRRRK